MIGIIKAIQDAWLSDEFCPNCGYYCNGSSIYCTKGIDIASSNDYNGIKNTDTIAKTNNEATQDGNVSGQD